MACRGSPRSASSPHISPSKSVVELKVRAYSPQISENGIFGINLLVRENSGLPLKKLNIDVQLEIILYTMES